MSFYGSVYYQLIDTFYKVIVKNNGDKNYDFNEKLVNPSGTPADDVVESPATGRKGIFSLDSGNYWINFSKNENDTKEAAPYKIWHSKAHNDSKTMKRVSSWDIKTSEYESEFDDYGIETKFYRKDDPEKTDLRETDHYIQLQEHDMLKLYESNYDEAGHVIQDQTKEVLYRLPKTSVNENVNWLMNLVGKPNVDLPRWDVPVEEQEGEQTSANSILTLTDYAEKNYEDIKTLEDYVGDWPSITQYWGESWHIAPTIKDVIGRVEDLFGEKDGSPTNYSAYSTYKDYSIVKILGNLPNMWKRLDKKNEPNPISFTDAIIKIADDFQSSTEDINKDLGVHDTAINGLNAIVGHSDRPKEEVDSVYEELDKIFITIDEDTENRGNIYPAINALHDRIDNEVSNLQAADTEIIKNYQEADSDLTSLINEKDSKVREDFSKADNQIISDYKAADTAIDTAYKTADSKIISDYKAADLKISNAYKDADTALEERVNDNIGLLSDTVKALDESHKKDIETINNTINGNDNTVSIIKRLDGHDTSIENNTKDISDIKTEIGAPEDNTNNTIYGKINENTKKFENYALTATVNSLSNNLTNNYQLKSDAFTKDQADGLYSPIGALVESDIKDLREDVSNLDQQVTSINALIGDVTSLEEGQNIISLLEQILNEIEGIKTRIDELHPTEQDPEVPEDET